LFGTSSAQWCGYLENKSEPLYGDDMQLSITMNDSLVCTLQQLKAFLKLNAAIQFNVQNKIERYHWIAKVLTKFNYHRLKKKKERGIVRRYIRRMSGISKAQLNRLILRHKITNQLVPYATATPRRHFSVIYEPADIALLIETDYMHHHLSGAATKKILEREYEMFKRTEYKTISKISAAHLYSIRNNNRQYNSSKAKWIKHTKAAPVNIGLRSKPNPQGKPGFLRVDTVHQGDFNGLKGPYHINIVDEATQYELIATVEKISERFLKPVIEELLNCFPFMIYEFHSDNGSEYINQVVAKLLTKMYIKFTKSRARHSNDNALVESKNGSVIRKLYGRNYLPAHTAPFINQFNHDYVNIYLNYHRPCGFAENIIDAKGKIKKIYNHWTTPYEKLKALPNANQYLKAEITFDQLDKIAYAESDNQFAEQMRNAQIQLFKQLRSFI
jgi:hypothetical protein